ncbi:MAG: DUF4139 domain-containing protein [Armatimonadetes bacterium]|nr:DUF4139 domain-containing protein [Armatimonadota bacterium]
MITALFAIGAMLVPGSTEVTVYNQGLGFIKDVRTVNLTKGTQDVMIEDVAQLIDATSVGFKCLNNPGSVSILEQNYRYDLISPEAILQKSVGKRVRFTRTMGNKKETLEGVLVSSPTSVVNTGNGGEYRYNGLVIRADDGRIVLSPEGEIEVTEIPEGLISKPSLLWQVDSDRAQQAKMELSYLTQGMKWTANYVLTMDSEASGDLQGWVTLDNKSGVSFQDATLKLLAGDVHVARSLEVSDSSGRYAYGAAMRNQPTLKVENLFEYHLYTLERPATVKNNESKQLSLLEGFNIPLQKVIAFSSYVDDDGPQTHDIDSEVRIKFINDKKSHLGMPLPAGKIRLYQRDSKGSVQFLGEDTIYHTPKDEKVSLTVGKSFDIKATHKRASWKKISKNVVRMDIEVEVRNRKTEPQTVYIYENLDGEWKILSHSEPFVKDDAGTAVFEVKLATDQVKTLKYTVEIKR